MATTPPPNTSFADEFAKEIAKPQFAQKIDELVQPEIDQIQAEIDGTIPNPPVTLGDPTDPLVSLINGLGFELGAIFGNLDLKTLWGDIAGDPSERPYYIDTDDETALLRVINALGFVAVEILNDGTTYIGGVAGYVSYEQMVAFVTSSLSGYVTIASTIPATPVPIFGPHLFMTSDRKVTLYPSSLMTNREDKMAATITITSLKSLPAPPLAVQTRFDPLELDPALMGTTATLTVRPYDQGDRIVQAPWIVRNTTVPKVGSPARLAFILGDSISNRQFGSFLKTQLEAWGAVPTFIGTMNGSATGSQNDTGGPLGEAREGWAFCDFDGTNISSATNGVLPAGDEAAYMALDKEEKRQTQIFLRLATGGDPPEDIVVINGIDYVFDLAFYQSRFGLATPQDIYLNLGMNDRFKFGTGAPAEVQRGLNVMIDRMRRAWPTANIIVWCTTIPRDTAQNADGIYATIWAPVLAKINEVVRLRIAAGDTRLFLSSTWSEMSPEAEWFLNAATPSVATGLATTTVFDITHPIASVRRQMVNSFSRAAISFY